jgi:hypothetical protein
MTEHPMQPTEELVQQWWEEADRSGDRDDPHTYFDFIAKKAAQWGSDQELDACCSVVGGLVRGDRIADHLRTTRRPKPPSLKQQALTDLSEIGSHYIGPGAAKLIDTIRRALESLPDD